MEGLLLLLLFPLIWPWVAKKIWHSTISWQEVCLNIVIVVALSAGVWKAGIYSKTTDVEIWNGQVLKKAREEVSCSHSYSCNCVEVCSGSGSERTCTDVCQTCYEHPFDVDWMVYSEAGNFTIDRVDRQGTEEPFRWARVQKGQPVALSYTYVNYIKAVPESLFHNESSIQERFSDMIPHYPSTIYDYHYINRVIPVGISVSDLNEWNHELALALRKLGPIREANAVIVLVKTSDPSYRFALEEAWLGGKKNDIVLILGTPDFPEISWADVMSWTDNHLFKVQLRDALLELGVADRTSVLALLSQHTLSSFVRKPMADFEYLKDEIDPPAWAMVCAIFIAIGGSIGLSIVFQKYDVDLRNLF